MFESSGKGRSKEMYTKGVERLFRVTCRHAECVVALRLSAALLRSSATGHRRGETCLAPASLAGAVRRLELSGGDCALKGARK